MSCNIINKLQYITCPVTRCATNIAVQPAVQRQSNTIIIFKSTLRCMKLPKLLLACPNNSASNIPPDTFILSLYFNFLASLSETIKENLGSAICYCQKYIHNKNEISHLKLRTRY